MPDSLKYRILDRAIFDMDKVRPVTGPLRILIQIKDLLSALGPGSTLGLRERSSALARGSHRA
jgi:hypothetical protein